MSDPRFFHQERIRVITEKMMPGDVKALADILTEHGAEALRDRGELVDKIQFLVSHLNGLNLLEDGSFTFPDGETWSAQ